MNITRRQHYVWRKYLTSWAEGGQVYRLRNGLIKKINPIHLAVENDFNKIDLIDSREYELVKALLIPNKQQPHFLKETNIGWFKFFDNVFFLLKAAKFCKIQRVEKFISSQAMEDFCCKTEEGGVYLNDLLNQNLDFWEHEDKKFDFLFYLSFQYLRTKRMRHACLSTMDDIVKKISNNNLPKLSPTGYAILSVIFSSNITYAFLKGDASIKLIKNNSGIYFITGDQPVVNVIQDKKEGEPYPKDMEFYYPVSPKLGIFISHSGKFSLGYGDEVNANEVSYLNSLIVDNHEEQLFGNREKDLVLLVNESV